MRGAIQIAILLVIVLLTSASASAQSGESHRTPSMRETVYDKLSRAQESANGGNFADAIKILRDLEKLRDLNPYEKAQIYSAYGFIYFSQEEYSKSIRSYEKVIEQEGLPEAMTATTVYTLAQISFQMEEYEKTTDYLRNWIASATNPGPDPYIMLGHAYHELGRYRDAIEPVETAARIARERGNRIEESWYMLLRVCYFELKNYTKVIDVLELLVADYGRKEYWTQLSATYGEIGNENKQLAIYEMAYYQGLLDQGREIVLLAQLLLQGDVPHRAGVVLAKGIDDGLVEKSEANYHLLSQAWTLAKEDHKTIDALTNAARLSSDGEFDARIAYVYANLADWENVITFTKSSLKKGIREKGQIQIMLGMALIEQKRFEDAKAAFRVAQSSPETERTATQWVQYIDSEQERLAELERSLGD